MKRCKSIGSDERGATLVEFALAATVFLVSVFGVLEFARAIWVHNALADAARRGARYAVLHAAADSSQVKNVVVYGNPAGTGNPVVNNLAVNNVNVNYSQFSLGKGTVTVSITSYQFQFVLPLLRSSITMPSYTTTLTGESIGLIPADM
jgi:Flp pilus assembly protein TadG